MTVEFNKRVIKDQFEEIISETSEFEMKYYFFDTSGLFGNFRKEQHTDEMGDLFWNALNEGSEGKPSFGYKNIIVSHFLSYEIIKSLITKANDENVLLQINKFLIESNSFIKIEVTKDILKKSITLIEKYSLKSYDAIQLACALEAKDKYEKMIFVANDRNLIKAARIE